MYTDTFTPSKKEHTCSETPALPDTNETFASDEDVLAVSLCLINQNREAYEVLAK